MNKNINAKIGGDRMSKLELTLAILKPDLFMRATAREFVKELIVKKGFLIVRQADFHLNREVTQQFYAEHKGKFFYNRLVDFMCVASIHCMILAHPNAIQHWRDIMGPTKPYLAQNTAPMTIRGIFGLTDTRNSTHGSDSKKSAQREINILFPDFNVDDWYQNAEPFMRTTDKYFTKKHIQNQCS